MVREAPGSFVSDLDRARGELIDARIALGAVAPTVMLASETAKFYWEDR